MNAIGPYQGWSNTSAEPPRLSSGPTYQLVSKVAGGLPEAFKTGHHCTMASVASDSVLNSRSTDSGHSGNLVGGCPTWTPPDATAVDLPLALAA